MAPIPIQLKIRTAKNRMVQVLVQLKIRTAKSSLAQAPVAPEKAFRAEKGHVNTDSNIPRKSSFKAEKGLRQY